MSKPIDAVVVAGTGDASKNFSGVNKNLLPVAGRPVLGRVIDALDGARTIRRIFVVGPSNDLKSLVASCGQAWKTRVQVVQQKETALDNALAGFYASLGPRYRPGDERRDPQVAAHPALIMGGDLPLVSAAEIDEFLTGCASKDIDYGLGLTEEAHLRRFYPAKGKPGIRMAYLHLATGSFRLNNLHFARPFRIGNMPYLQRIDRARYQRELGNMLRIAKDMLVNLGLRPVLTYLLLQCCVLLQSLGLRRLLAFARRWATEAIVTNAANRMLRTRAAIITTSGGGAAIDVDNERDYQTIEARFKEFTKPQRP